MTPSIPRIETALRQLGAEHEPPHGWQARVLAATRPRPRGCLWRLVIPIAVALIMIAPIFWPHSGPPEDGVALHVAVEPAGPIMRGNSAHIGDRVHVTATSRDRYRALWVYRDERELVVACPGGPSCRRDGDTTTADLTLLAVGSYAIVAVTATVPLPAPRGAYDADNAAARELGAAIESQPLKVR